VRRGRGARQYIADNEDLRTRNVNLKRAAARGSGFATLINQTVNLLIATIFPTPRR